MALITKKSLIRKTSVLGTKRNGFVVITATMAALPASLSQSVRQCMPTSAGLQRRHRVHKDANAALDNPAAMRAGRPVGLSGASRSWPSLTLARGESEFRLPGFGRSARYRRSSLGTTAFSSATAAR